MPTDDRIVVKPRKAAEMLGCGITRLYDLIKAREIQSFKDGRSRKITTDSIRAYIDRHLTPTDVAQRRGRGRPRKCSQRLEAAP
jgi:excisionase family DNA binding protein